MTNISTGAGLVFVGIGLALHPVFSRVLTSNASATTGVTVSALALTQPANAVPTIVWMGVHSLASTINYHRMWSDGRIEMRSVLAVQVYNACGNVWSPCSGTPNDWIEVPPPLGGNGFACRSDINGDRVVDGADLAFVLNSWGQNGSCEPAATYPCFNLGDLTIAAAMK